RPYAAPPGVLVAALWTRDGRDWLFTDGLSATEACEQKDKRRQQGFEPMEAAGYLDGDRERYAVVWVKAGPLTPNPSPPSTGEGRKRSPPHPQPPDKGTFFPKSLFHGPTFDVQIRT